MDDPCGQEHSVFWLLDEDAVLICMRLKLLVPHLFRQTVRIVLETIYLRFIHYLVKRPPSPHEMPHCCLRAFADEPDFLPLSSTATVGNAGARSSSTWKPRNPFPLIASRLKSIKSWLSTLRALVEEGFIGSPTARIHGIEPLRHHRFFKYGIPPGCLRSRQHRLKLLPQRRSLCHFRQTKTCDVLILVLFVYQLLTRLLARSQHHTLSTAPERAGLPGRGR